jgi:ankyrin repeat protein
LKTNGATPLHVAASKGHARVIKQLIAGRCKVDIQDKKGYTPFFIAVHTRHFDIVDQLINARCKTDLASTGGLTTVSIYYDIIKQLTNARCKTQKGLNGPNKDNGYYEIDTRLSSRPESPHIDSLFISLGRRQSSPCTSILRMPDSVLKTVNVHHAATRFVHTIPPLALYNSEYLRTRTEMRHITVLNKQNKAVIRAAEGTKKLPHVFCEHCSHRHTMTFNYCLA